MVLFHDWLLTNVVVVDAAVAGDGGNMVSLVRVLRLIALRICNVKLNY